MIAATKKEKPSYNPVMLRWARELCGQSVEEVAHRLHQKPEKIAAWEDASEVPTVKQARSLAELYNRAFVEFFLEEPPALQESAMVPDFRTYRGVDLDTNHRQLKDIQLWAEAQRTNALDLFQELGEEPPAFPDHLFATIETRVDDAARAMRDAMGFTIDDQLSLKSQELVQLPNILRRKLEQIGILTLKDSSLGQLRARGMCLVSFPLPTIVFGSEAPSAQAFTLAHELAHVLLRESGIIAPLAYSNETGKPHTEAWCDQFAASFLMPREAIIKLLGEAPAQRLASISDDHLSYVAKALRVSPHAMLIRLVHLGYVERRYYWDVKKAEFEKEEASYKAFGRAPYYGTRYKNSLGDLYTGLVMEAWTNGRITNHNAAEYMGIKNLQHLYDIRSHFGVP